MQKSKMLSRILLFLSLTITLCPSPCSANASAPDTLARQFADPPRSAGVRCWWWWLNSNVTKQAITRDLEAMHEKGFSGAMIFDAGGANQRGNAQVPAGPTFAGPEWTELYLHALREAHRLGLKIGLSIQSGWNLGGPFVTPDFAAKKLTCSETQIEGPAEYDRKLPLPDHRGPCYKDICVLAYPLKSGQKPRPIENLNLKAAFSEIGMSAPDTRFLLDGLQPVHGEQYTILKEIRNLTSKIKPDGTLKWSVPKGNWTVLRFGYATTNARVSTSSAGWNGPVIDYLSEQAFNRYWSHVVEPLLEKAGPLVGTTLTHLETDSWECGGMNWTPDLPAQFKKYRGYDPIPYLPVIAGKIVKSRQASNAFLADFRKTIADCVSDNHYKVFAEHAARHKLGIQPESAGPHAGPIDGIKNYCHSDITMSEFWVPSPHRPTSRQRFFVKQAASAAHIYGKKLVAAESFTSIGPHWNDVLWQSQKPSMDHEFCSGLNMIFFHTFTCSPEEMGMPGQEYFAGTHINPQVTWWDYADAFVNYINRVQYIVQRGKFVADVLYYYGDHVPNIFPLKESDPAGVLPGYDYDVTNEEILLELKVVAGKILVPGGVRYRLLALPDHKVLSLAALEKVEHLLQKGATILGPKPQRLVSLVGGESAQKRFHTLAVKIWGESPSESGQKKIGKGRLIWGKNARTVLQADAVMPDFEAIDAETRVFDYIHYTINDVNVYFVCNQTDRPHQINCAFRITGRQPQIFDPLTGRARPAEAFTQTNHRTTLPLRFDPYGSFFVLFRKPIPKTQQGSENSNFHHLKTVKQIRGPWQVSFDPNWGGPPSVIFDELTDWSQHQNPGIKYYSGKAVYRNTFALPDIDKSRRYWLVLNCVKDVGIASVKINGKEIGTTWTKPFRLEVTNAIKPSQNRLIITVVNSWRNRLVGDRRKPQNRRYTKTNIAIRKEWKLTESGLLGPVKLKNN